MSSSVPTETSRRFVLDKCDYFTDVQLWPTRARLDPSRWLSNFRDDETDHAIQLLSAFMYFSEPLVDRMFVSAFQSLSYEFTLNHRSRADAASQWRHFVDSVLVTYVTGEDPSATDSGFMFARKARDILRLPQERILMPADALKVIIRTPRPILFVDDFVGSGNQCSDTWHRKYPVLPGTELSFADIAGVGGFSFYYTPLVCTEHGADTIRSRCAGLVLRPAHFLPATYAAVHPSSLVWPPHLLSTGPRFIKDVSARIGLPDTDGASTHDWQGFHKLGLCLSFYHAIPDATLPIFYWENNGWNPLIRMS